MKKAIPLFFICLFSFLYLTAQSLTPVVIANGGGFQKNGNSLSYTIGEIVVTTSNNSNNILTQGFEQPTDTDNVLGITEVNFNRWQIIAYPNPTSGNLNIAISAIKAGTVHFALVDMLGRTLFISGNKNVTNGDNKFNLNLSPFASGIYFIRFFSNEQDEGAIKVSKIQ